MGGWTQRKEAVGRLEMLQLDRIMAAGGLGSEQYRLLNIRCQGQQVLDQVDACPAHHAQACQLRIALDYARYYQTLEELDERRKVFASASVSKLFV